jgi:hypothetical protein
LLTSYTCMLNQVLHAFATEGAHCTKVREILNNSDVSLSNSYMFMFSLLVLQMLLMHFSVCNLWSRFGVHTKTRSTISFFLQMLNLQQLALLVSLRIHHRDSHTPLQLLHHNLLLLDLPHHPRLTLAESRINLCSKKRYDVFKWNIHPSLYL